MIISAVIVGGIIAGVWVTVEALSALMTYGSKLIEHFAK